MCGGVSFCSSKGILLRLLFQQREKVRNFHRPVKVEALDIVAACLKNGLKFLIRFHAFDADLLAELMAGVDDARYEVAVVLGIRHFLHQAAIEFYDVGGVLQEKLQGGISCAEVVERETNAEVAARFDECLQSGGAFVVVRFREFRDEILAVHFVAVKGLTHEGQEIGIEHLMITDVEVQGEVRIRAAYALGMDDCLLEDPASDSAYLLGALQDGDEYGRRYVRALVRPAAQKFAADDAETVGGDCRLDDRAEVRAAAFDNPR